MRVRFLIALLLSAVVLAPEAGANAPIRQSVTITDFTFPDAYLTNACGFSVVNTVNAKLEIIVFLDRTGTPVREIDSVHGTIAFAAHGKSVSQPMTGISHATYPQGVAPGSPAPTSLVGVNVGSLTGLTPPGAGRLVIDAEVVAVGPDGVPFTAFDTSDIVSRQGNFERATAEICRALT
jgi:hypothetical protein